jgi:hypothetical protein
MDIARGAMVETRVTNRDNLPLTLKPRHRRHAGLDAQDSTCHVIAQFGRSHRLDVSDFIDPGQFGQSLHLHINTNLIAVWLQISRIDPRGVRHSFSHLLEVHVGRLKKSGLASDRKSAIIPYSIKLHFVPIPARISEASFSFL